MPKIQIGKHFIGEGEKAFIIAEAGVNHNGSLERAKELIDKAATVGAGAIKFQTYKADTLVTKTAPKFWDWEGDKEHKTQHAAYSQLDKFPWENYKILKEHCDKKGIEFLSTPFDFKSADMLDEIGMVAFKIASSDITYLQFLSHIAKKGKPMIISTGASTMLEIKDAVETIKKEGNNKIILLHCNLCYPTKDKDSNLKLIQTLKDTFPSCEVGLSDHTIGTFAPSIAVALGASIIEKHYTLDHDLGESADHWLSVNPTELFDLIAKVRKTEEMFGSSEKQVFDSEFETYKYDKRSITSARDIMAGTVITKEDITFKRPGTGIPPKGEKKLLGKRAEVAIPEDTTIEWKMIC